MEDLTDIYLTSEDLADRWKMTLHTLEQWRWKGHGPHFIKFGKRILYHQDEIEKFEASITQITTTDTNDRCFLCISLESLVTEEKEETPMGP